MGAHLPSKRIFFLIIACTIGVCAVGFAVYATKNPDSQLGVESKGTLVARDNKAKTVEMIEKTLRENAESDDDSDGLLNWEEALWGTSQNNADSDKDGTKDGEEVRVNRNPAKTGPDDKLTVGATGGAGSETGTGANGTKSGEKIVLETTETARISRELFTNYLEAKRTGVALDADIQNQIINETFSNESLSPTYKQYSLADVRINSDSNVTTSADLKKYGNDLGLALSAGKASSAVTEIEILHTALTEERPTEIAKLDPIVNGYNLILNQLALVSVPQEYVGYHLEILNSVSRFLGDIKSFRKIFEDPMVGISGVSNYYPDLEAMQASLGRIKTVFISQGISFEQTEYGHVFMQTI